MRSAKIQISLSIRAVLPKTSLGTLWIAKDAKFVYAENEGSEQTARMHRLILVLVGHIRQNVIFSDVAAQREVSTTNFACWRNVTQPVYSTAAKEFVNEERRF